MPPIPSVVTNIRVENLNSFQRHRKILWDRISDPTIVNYKIYRSEVSYGDFELVGTVAGTLGEYTDSNIPFTAPMPFEWWYKVTSVNAQSGESSLTDTLPAPDIKIDWFDPPQADVPESLSEQNQATPDTISGEPCDRTNPSPTCYKPPSTKMFDNEPGGLQTLPSTDIDPRWFLEIRRRHKWILEAGGIPVVLLKRRWSGTLCPEYDGLRGQHKRVASIDISDPCYGTNFVGGYHLPIHVLVSFINPALKSTQRKDFGMWFEFEPKSWTLWQPNLLDRDLIVREDTGERYEITNVSRTRWRGLVLRQNFDIRLIERSAIEYKIPIS